MDDKDFPKGAAALLEKLTCYLKWYQSINPVTFYMLKTTFTKDAFDMFNPKMVNSKPIKPSQVLDSLKVWIVDFSKSSGKDHEWPAFYKCFTAICNIQGLSELLEEDANHEDKFSSDVAYQEKTCLLFLSLRTVVLAVWA